MDSMWLVRLAGAGVVALGSAVHASGQAVHPVLVELFTSEGCSSCPPADALLRQLDAKQTETGQLVVGISEHVTYWNRLGWADPFSAEAYTKRQDGYRARFRLDSAYTPQMVVNGEREVLGSDRGAVLRAIRETDRPGEVTVRIGSAKLVGGALRVTYSTTGRGLESGDELFAVIAEDAVSSQVARGENGGRTLSHVSVARSMTRIGRLTKAAEATVDLPIGEPRGGRQHVILFAQGAGLGRVLAVDVAPIG